MGENPSPVGEGFRLINLALCKITERRRIVYMIWSWYISVSKLVQMIKGKTSRKMLSEFNPLQQKFWGRHLWARGYFVASSGNITDDVIIEYIEKQDIEGDDEDFKIASET